jgi:translation initiation factor 4G
VAEESRRNKFVKEFKDQLKIQGVKPQEDEKPAEKTASQSDTEVRKPAIVDGSGIPEAKEAEVAPEPAKQPEPAQPEPAKEPAKETEVPPQTAKEPETESKDAPENKSLEEDEEERWIRELEEAERLEEERERAYTEKKKAEAAAKKLAEAAPTDEELKRQEREAEEREEAKLKGKSAEESTEAKAEKQKMFSALAKSSIGPGSAEASGQTTPAESAAMPPPPVPSSSKSPLTQAARPKPTMLKLETTKSVEPAQPTAGMQSLRSARFLQLQSEEVNYPAGIRSPNPALNQGARTQGRQYDKDFLLQFQEVFKEKPSVDWDKTLKETLGEPDSARPQSARTVSMGGRQPSRGPTSMHPMSMGSFTATTRTLPPGTTSDQRFQASNQMVNPLSQFAIPKPASLGRQSMPFPMPAVGGMGTGRSGSSRGPASNSPRNGSGRNQSRQSKTSAAQEEKLAKTMPLTAGKDLKPLVVSTRGWKPTSLTSGNPQQSADHMPPDMVQRKVKAALNKMTPENFPKITDGIVAIASQSKEETDGRTLRQIIQLTFEKACDEAHWSNMYARFCHQMFQDLDGMHPPIQDDAVRDKAGNVVTGGALFRKYLLTRCQEEFERGWEVNLPDKPEGETQEAVLLSDEYYEAAAAKRKGLGLVQFIGELYKLGMLNIRIMHECVHKLLDFKGMPDESSVESLVKLLRTVGQTMERDGKGLEMVKVYFDRMQNAMHTEGLPSRTYYMLLDIIDLRRNGWVSKDSDKGPKTIQEIRNDAARAQDAARQNNMRGGGGRPPMGGRDGGRQYSSGGMPPPPDYTKNHVGIEDLKKLTRNARSNQSFAATSFGPSNMLGSRSNSGRKGLGPMSKDDSGHSSRTGTPPVKDKETRNAFE